MPRKKAVPPTPEEAIQLLLNAELNGRTVRELALDSASYSFNDLRAQLNASSYKILDSAGITLMPMFDEYTNSVYYVIKLGFPKKLAAWLPDMKKAALVVYDYCWGITLDGKPFDIYTEREGAKPAAPEAAKPKPTPKVVALPKPARTRPARNATTGTMTPEEACRMVWNALYKGRTVGQWATALWHITEGDVMAGNYNEHEGREETEELGLMLVMDGRTTYYVFVVRPDRLFKRLPELKPCAAALELCEGIGIGGAPYLNGDAFAPDPVLHSPKPRLVAVK